MLQSFLVEERETDQLALRHALAGGANAHHVPISFDGMACGKDSDEVLGLSELSHHVQQQAQRLFAQRAEWQVALLQVVEALLPVSLLDALLRVGEVDRFQ